MPADNESRMAEERMAEYELLLYEKRIPMPIAIPSGVMMMNKSPRMTGLTQDLWFMLLTRVPRATPSKNYRNRLSSC